ncbi:PTS sugar transporter subunit IIA [Bosea rubneri]|jgi:PTS system nitrogen regulatory IIA component|uniref:PTS sugar transporter subunit IIA n=2 Tax=Bosea TaxID=85413 RepID=A0ABU3S0W9_9HYPH|nr:PTS sugar transporter subunit IIA [Bosea sp. ZW T0_25]MDU0338420.1 PTS sugar transporter subunit IIA [Bosea sp. ZW T0_25]
MEAAVNIMKFLGAEDIALDLPAASKQAAIESAADRLCRGDDDGDRKAVLQALNAREQLGSTALGRGVALPHARTDVLGEPRVALMRLEQPVDFGAADGDPVDLVLAVVWPAEAMDDFLGTLSKFCKMMREPRLLQGLRDAADSEAASQLLRVAAEQTAPAQSAARA